MVDRRVVVVYQRVLSYKTVEIFRNVVGDIGVEGITGQIGDAVYYNAGLESIGLGNRPGGHVASIALPHDSESVGVGDSAFDQAVYALHKVVKILDAPVREIGVGEFRAVSCGASDIGTEKRKSLVG
jgi:hypothetical protein